MIEIDFTVKPKEFVPEYITDYRGNKFTVDETGELHSYNDMPSYISVENNKFWHKHGERHRDNDLPALIWGYGKKEWWVDGVRIK